MFTAVLLFAAATADAPAKYEDDLLCAAAMDATMSNPPTIPGVDEDTIKAAQFGRQFYFGRLTARDETINWPTVIAEREKTLNVMEASNLIVPCLGRKAQLIKGSAPGSGG